MAKKQKKKCYAIHFIGNKKDVIVDSWTECQELMKGHNNMFKGFMTEEEAKKWLGGITGEQEDLHDQQVRDRREAKRIKDNQIEYRFVMDNELSEAFQKKLNGLHYSINRIMNEMVREYVYGEDD